MVILTNFTFVIDRHFFPFFRGDKKGLENLLFMPPHGPRVAKGNKIRKKKG